MAKTKEILKEILEDVQRSYNSAEEINEYIEGTIRALKLSINLLEIEEGNK